MKIRNIICLLFNKMLPINKKLIVFTAYNGKLCDSPLSIYFKMKELIPADYNLVWLIKKEYFNKANELGIEYIDYDSPESRKYLATAYVIIDNVYGGKEVYLNSNNLFAIMKFKLLSWLKYKSNQHVYTTWHGSALKKDGIDEPNSNILDFNCPNTTMILCNSASREIFKHLTFDKLKYTVISLPRNDRLYNLSKETIETIKKQLHLPTDKKIVLFAPSFRAKQGIYQKDVNRSGINQLSLIDFEKLFKVLNERFGGDWVFVCRFHYHVSNVINWCELNNKYCGRIINGNIGNEMTDYLICSDILISDVSSCLIDFMSTQRPSYLFFPDKEYYFNEERGGIYFDINELPFPLAISFDELCSNIRQFNQNKYLSKMSSFKDEIGFIDNPNSSIDVCKFILDDLNLSY